MDSVEGISHLDTDYIVVVTRPSSLILCMPSQEAHSSGEQGRQCKDPLGIQGSRGSTKQLLEN